jgi:hypothetical protein
MLERGEDATLKASDGSTCLHLPGDPGALYLVVPHSTGTLGGVEHAFSLVGLTEDGAFPAFSPKASLVWPLPGLPSEGSESLSFPVQESSGPGPELDLEAVLAAQDRWSLRLREMERELFSPRGGGSRHLEMEPALGPLQAPAVPEIGDRRTFHVLNAENQFEKVRARVRFVSDHALIYLDEETPPSGYSEADLLTFAGEFSDPIHPTITGEYGEESDLDGNGRIIILFTPAVNRLTEAGSDGFVGGFFYGWDLLLGKTGSNNGEVFYAIVPDPTGIHGPVISRYAAMTTVPAVLAHEFTHMVHFNQRMRVAGAESAEALWLSEALAQMGEDLVADAFDSLHQMAKAEQYRSGNHIRAKRFLENPSQVSPLASLPPGSLAERGGGWLFLKQVLGRAGRQDLLRVLTSSRKWGTENVTEAVGVSWPQLVSDWAGSLFLDGTGVPVRPELRVAGVNLRNALAYTNGSYPLTVIPFGETSSVFSGTLWPSSPDYFIINPTAGGLTLGAAGALGGIPEAGLGLQLLVVRLL